MELSGFKQLQETDKESSKGEARWTNLSEAGILAFDQSEICHFWSEVVGATKGLELFLIGCLQ